MTVSEFYNRLLAGELRAAGFALEAREPTPGKNPVAEIVGVDRRLLDWGSTRKAAITERTDSLVAEYREAHGREPSAKILRDLKQRATLETRPTKKDARPLAVRGHDVIGTGRDA